MKKRITLMGLLSLLFFTGCQKNTSIQERTYLSGIKGDLYTSFVADETTVISDVIYDSKKQLGMDVYLCQSEDFREEPRAGILLFHGGGFTKGDKKTDDLTKALSIDLSRMGYIVFNVNYSLSKEGNISAVKKACQDIENAVQYIQEHSEEYGVDKHHLALGGYSAGAILAKDLVYSNRYQVNTNDIFAVIDLAGGNLSFGSPDETNPDCFIVHGIEDTTVPYSDALDFANQLEQNQVVYELYAIEEIGHTLISEFDNIRNKSAEFLYERLTGQSVSIQLFSKTNPEYEKIETGKRIM